MKLETYVAKLASLLPSEQMMVNAGFDGIPRPIKKGYLLESKSIKTNIIDGEGLIIDLFNNFKTEYIRFGDYTFYNEIESKNGSFIFGGSSYSELSFVSFNSEVNDYDIEEGTLLYHCAANTECFLEAILILSEIKSLRLQRLIKVDDVEQNARFLERCVASAGGKKYRAFYELLIY